MSKILVAFNTFNLANTNPHPPTKQFLSVSWRLINYIVTNSRVADTGLDVFDFKKDGEMIDDIINIPCTESLATLCQRRATELYQLAKTQDKGINILWSGGVDSTAAVCSFLTVVPKEDYERITILMTDRSIDEYPLFFRKFILPNFKIRSAFVPFKDFIDNGNSLLVTGELGDQLFGSDIIGHTITHYADPLIYLSTEYKKILVDYFSVRLRSPELGLKFFEKYETIVPYSPLPIKTLFDFLWWWNFSQKWNHVKYRMLLLCDASILPTFNQNLNHFYDATYFQTWSLHNHHKKILDTSFQTYKIELKRIIADFTKDETYLLKPKLNSLGSLFYMQRMHIALDDTLTPMSLENISDFTNFQFKF